MGHISKEITKQHSKIDNFYHSICKLIRNIVKFVNLSHSTVQYVIKRFEEENRIENIVRKGRPRTLTKRDERFIIRKFLKNPR